MSVLDNAQTAARKAIESTYIGTCDVIEYSSGTGEGSRITRQSETTVYTDIPCRLSYTRFNNFYPAVPTDTVTTVSQPVKLFLAPEIEIKSGSKMIITQNGVTTAYRSSGQPLIYDSHQEIALELFRGWT